MFSRTNWLSFVLPKEKFVLLFSLLEKNLFFMRVEFECIQDLGFELFSLHYFYTPCLINDFFSLTLPLVSVPHIEGIT